MGIFLSEILIAFGYTTSCQKKKLESAAQQQMDRTDHGLDMGVNPLHIDSEAEVRKGADTGAILQSKSDLQEAQDTIQRMQDELKAIKQERKRAELDSMGSFKGRPGRMGGPSSRSRQGRAPSKKKQFGTAQMDGPDTRTTRGDTLDDAT